MRFLDLVTLAFSGLWRRKLRTSLTVLAVVIGATLVVLMVSLGNGLQGFIIDQFGLMVPQETLTVSTSDRLIFNQGGPPHEVTSTEIEMVRPFTKEDMDKLRAIDGVERVDYFINVPALYVSPEDSDKKYSVFANAPPDYEARLRQLVAGDYFSEDSSGKCLIAYDYLDTFGWTDAETALGSEVVITVGKQSLYDQRTMELTFTVVGVIEKTLNAAEIIIPVEDAKEMARYSVGSPLLYTEQQPGLILQVKAADATLVDQVARDIRALGFGAITASEVMDEINNVFGIIQVGLSAFGIIALVVATIGIINTLMMAIHERTREIGVMKAVGATKATIRLLFTAEGGALGFLGGVIGVIAGFILGQLLNIIGSQTFLSDFPNFKIAVFPFWLIFGVIGLTTAISLLAGLYPANRAAQLDPVEALRYE